MQHVELIVKQVINLCCLHKASIGRVKQYTARYDRRKPDPFTVWS